MHNVKFYYKGQTIEVEFNSDSIPKDKLSAEGLAWGAIRMWFSENHKTIPDHVKNDRLDGIEEFIWDVLPLSSCLDSSK